MMIATANHRCHAQAFKATTTMVCKQAISHPIRGGT